jgi:Zn-dependent M28 family amino/carboxypeptidase
MGRVDVRNTVWLFATAIALVAVPVGAASTGEFSTQRLSEIDKAISADAFQGRGTAAPIEPTVIQYIADQMKAAGVQPGGDVVNGQRSWFQNVPLLESQITGTPNISLNENGTVAPLRQGPDIAVLAPLNGAKQVDIENAPLVFVGYGVVAPERQWNDFKGQDMHGKILVELVNDPDFEAAAGDPVAGKFGGKAMTYYGRWTYKFEEGARKGAAAVLVVHETGPAGYPFSVVQGNLNEKFDVVTPDKNMGRANIEGWITTDAARKLFALAGKDYEALKKEAATRAFKPVPLGVQASMAISNKLRRIESRNVVAKLEGSDAPLKDEYVVYSAHWDHLGVGAPVNGDKIYNGALDNASGVGTVLEIARAFKQVQPQPKRSILFLMVTAEEQGLLGSQYYSVTPLYPLARTAANINIDGVNQWGPTKDITVIGLGASDLDDYLRAAAKEQGRTLTPDPEPEKGFYYRSDHFNFAKQGVPALDPDSGVDFIGKPDGWGRKKRDDYTDHDYHAPSDEVKPDWDLSGAAQDAQLLFAVGYRVANADKLPEWKPGNEFRAKRQEMLAR